MSKKKKRRNITAPLSGYVSEKGREAIRRLQATGFNYDLAFAMAEASIPQEEFYDLYECVKELEDEHVE